MKFIPITYRILMNHRAPELVTGLAFASGTDAQMCVRHASDWRGSGWRVDEYNTGCALVDAGADHPTPEAAAVAGIVTAAYRMGRGQWDKGMANAAALVAREIGAQP